jgi:hypothetical protein
MTATSATLMQLVALRIASLRSNGWDVEWSPVGSYIDLVAVCQ